jgi:hypothetical protein
MKPIASEEAQVASLKTRKFFSKFLYWVNVKMQWLLMLLRISCVYSIILFISCHSSRCELKNGYGKDILIAKESLKGLTTMLIEDKTLSGIQRKKIESKIEILVEHISFYDLTENLLSQFKIIAPSLYGEIDTISDRRGRPVHVYVKFVPVDATKIKAWGLTYIDQAENDKDAYRSEYGALTVSVKIWIVPKALIVLSHELGHVKYQIPNLATYVDFHKKCYTGEPSNFIGHHPGDPSGTSANAFEKLFRKEYYYFLRNTDEKIQNPVVLLVKIRKSMHPKHYAVVNTWRPTVVL